jgi:hydroxymethylpyrimidine pyrophosphatase-like HAD family hydrolase
MTMRPGQTLDRVERRRIKQLADDDGVVVVLDDPPVSGASVSEVVAEVRAAGMPQASIVLLLAVAKNEKELPAPLTSMPNIVLETSRWEITRRLGRDEVDKTVRRLLPAHLELLSISPLDHPLSRVADERAHSRSLFDVCLFDSTTQRERPAVVIAEGVGLGFFGRHSIAVGTRLPYAFPELLGFEDGILYQLLSSVATDVVPPEAVSGYITARARALPVEHDAAAAIAGRQTVPEVAAEVLGRALGRAEVATRLWLTIPLARRLLAVDSPSIVDGFISRDAFVNAGNGTDAATVRWRKLDFADADFSNRELLCHDPVYDLASPLDDDPSLDRVLVARSRSRWELAHGRPVEADRWLLYRLVHVWRQRRANELVVSEHRRVSCALQDYIAEVFFRGLTAGNGPWCALDVDGVLETGVLGGTAPAADGAYALRALVAHGYRVVIATGRSALEVRDRCEAWPISGGVAEYGTAIVAHGQTDDLRTPAQVDVVERARELLAKRAGVSFDDSYHHIVRAFRTDRNGSRGGLDDDDIETLVGLPELQHRVVVVPGQDQTDIVPAGCDKASGIRALLHTFDSASTRARRPLAFAMGDGVADTEMLELATLPAVPRHAGIVPPGRGVVTRGSYQAGFANATAKLIGHRPGACPECRVIITGQTRAVLRLLSIRAAGSSHIPLRVARAVATAARVPRTSGDRRRPA